ncbi:pentapeptide repeat-containing protein [Kitasatospora sp. NPDC094028]
MEHGLNWWEPPLVALLFLAGLGFTWQSYLLSRKEIRSRSDKAKGSLFSSLGTGLLTGATVSIILLILQQSIQDAQAETSWRDTLASAPKLIGFDPANHPLKGITLSGKDLTGAQFGGKDLTDVHLSGVVLKGSYFNNAKLSDVNLQVADLSTADFKDAELSGVDLRGANLSHALIENPKKGKFHQVKANAYTCWPEGFLTNPQTADLAQEIIPTDVVNPDGSRLDKSKGAMYPLCKQPPPG